MNIFWLYKYLYFLEEYANSFYNCILQRPCSGASENHWHLFVYLKKGFVRSYPILVPTSKRLSKFPKCVVQRIQEFISSIAFCKHWDPVKMKYETLKATVRFELLLVMLDIWYSEINGLFKIINPTFYD